MKKLLNVFLFATISIGLNTQCSNKKIQKTTLDFKSHQNLKSAESEIYSLYLTKKYNQLISKIERNPERYKSSNTLPSISLVLYKIFLKKNHSKAIDFYTISSKLNEDIKNQKIKRSNKALLLLAKSDFGINNEGIAKNTEAVLALKHQALSELYEINPSEDYDYYIRAFTLQSIAWTYALSFNLFEAEKYNMMANQILKDHPNYDLITEGFIIKGAINNIRRSHKVAISDFTTAIIRSRKSKNIYQLEEVYPMISASYGEIKDYKQAMVYSWRGKYLMDSIAQNDKYLYNAKNIEKAILSRNANISKGINKWLVISICIILFFFFILSFLRKKHLHKIKKENSKTAVNTSTNDKSDEIYQLALLAKTNINAFYTKFQLIYPDFYILLKQEFPALNVQDINFCALIKLKFEIKQIATYTKSTVKAVESRRYRIIKKMNLKNQDDLYLSISKNY